MRYRFSHSIRAILHHPLRVLATFVPQCFDEDRLKRYLYKLLIQLTFNHKRPARSWRANYIGKSKATLNANRVRNKFSHFAYSFMIYFLKFFIFQDVHKTVEGRTYSVILQEHYSI